MEKHRKDRIYQRVQSEFGVNVFTHSYYCSGLLLENLKSKLKSKAWAGVWNICEI